MKRALILLQRSATAILGAWRAIVYNVCMVAGVTLVGYGVALHDLGAGLSIAGALIIGLTIYALRVTKGQ
jgi:hypothetical protein